MDEAEKFRLILDTKPIDCSDPSNEIHVIVCQKHFYYAMWCFKTYYIYNRVNYNLCMYDDGSLTEESKDLFKKHFIGCRIISKEEADNKAADVLKHFPYCKKVRDMETNVSHRKLFDYFNHTNLGYIITFDSDMIWYDKSRQIEDYLKDKIPFYVGGGWGYLNYIRDVSYLNLKKFRPVGNLNAGLLGCLTDNSFYDLEFIEKFLKTLYEAPSHFFDSTGKRLPTADLIGYSYTGYDEPTFSVLFGKYDKYKVIWAGGKDSITPQYCLDYNELFSYAYPNLGNNPVVSHFAGPFKGHYIDSIEYVIKRGFLEVAK